MTIWPNSNAEDPLLENQAELVKKYGIEQLEKPYPDSGVRNIGFAPKTGKWYGWSHRAVYGFKVGDVVKKGDVIARGSMYNHPDRSFDIGFTAKTLADARAMAAAFADAVS